MRSVREQLAQFRKSMEADGAAQRSECRRLVGTAVRRAGWLVDEVLQVTPYLSLQYGDAEVWQPPMSTLCARPMSRELAGTSVRRAVWFV